MISRSAKVGLATLVEPITAAYRDSQIDTATAEAFAAVLQDRQLEVWKEVVAIPCRTCSQRDRQCLDRRHACALDVSTLPESAISRDLFADRVLVERKVFMEAQTKPVEHKRHALTEEGWAEVVVSPREDILDRLHSMDVPQREFDEATSLKPKVAEERQQLEKAAAKLGDSDEASRLQTI